MEKQEIGIIESHASSGISCVGRPAVEVFRLAALVQGLKLEIKSPGLKMSRHGSALKFAKQITGLKSNDRAVQLARAEMMLEEARGHVVHVKEGDAQ